MNKLTDVGLIERARALAPLIAQEADAIERDRKLTEPVVSGLIENGLYRALLPQSVGGAEAPPEVFMQMLEEIAKADASTAWCLGQCNVCAMTSAYLDADAAREIFGAPDSILAWGAIAHAVQRRFKGELDPEGWLSITRPAILGDCIVPESKPPQADSLEGFVGIGILSELVERSVRQDDLFEGMPEYIAGLHHEYPRYLESAKKKLPDSPSVS